MKILSQNKKIGYNYSVLEHLEVGIVLQGWQVKSIKAGDVNITDSYAYIHKDELFLRGMKISNWNGMGNFEKTLKAADLKLLVSKQELKKLKSKLTNQGTTLAPSKLYLVHSYIKLELNLVKGKKKYDKREQIKEREQKRDLARELKNEKYF